MESKTKASGGNRGSRAIKVSQGKRSAQSSRKSDQEIAREGDARDRRRGIMHREITQEDRQAVRTWRREKAGGRSRTGRQERNYSSTVVAGRKRQSAGGIKGERRRCAYVCLIAIEYSVWRARRASRGQGMGQGGVVAGRNAKLSRCVLRGSICNFLSSTLISLFDPAPWRPCEAFSTPLFARHTCLCVRAGGKDDRNGKVNTLRLHCSTLSRRVASGNDCARI